MLTIKEVNLSPAEATQELHDDLLNRGVGNDTAASSGPLYHSRALLLKSPCTPGLGVILADLDPATYDGAAQQQVTWTPAANDELGLPYVIAGRLTFVATGSDTIGSQSVTGVALVGSDSVTLQCCANFDEPVTVNEDTPLLLDLTFGLRAPTNLG